jgi:hypothetical protein
MMRLACTGVAVAFAVITLIAGASRTNDLSLAIRYGVLLSVSAIAALLAIAWRPE